MTHFTNRSYVPGGRVAVPGRVTVPDHAPPGVTAKDASGTSTLSWTRRTRTSVPSYTVSPDGGAVASGAGSEVDVVVGSPRPAGWIHWQRVEGDDATSTVPPPMPDAGERDQPESAAAIPTPVASATAAAARTTADPDKRRRRVAVAVASRTRGPPRSDSARGANVLPAPAATGDGPWSPRALSGAGSDDRDGSGRVRGELSDSCGGRGAVPLERGDERVGGNGVHREQQAARRLRVGEEQLPVGRGVAPVNERRDERVV